MNLLFLPITCHSSKKKKKKKHNFLILLLPPVYSLILQLPINTSKPALAAPQLELNECKQPWLGKRRMSGVAEGGGQEMDGDTDRRGEDRRRDVHTLLSIEFLVTNGLNPALCELKPDSRPNTCKNKDMKMLISSLHANTYTQRQAVMWCLVLNIPFSNPEVDRISVGCISCFGEFCCHALHPQTHSHRCTSSMEPNH